MQTIHTNDQIELTPDLFSELILLAQIGKALTSEDSEQPLPTKLSMDQIKQISRYCLFDPHTGSNLVNVTLNFEYEAQRPE